MKVLATFKLYDTTSSAYFGDPDRFWECCVRFLDVLFEVFDVGSLHRFDQWGRSYDFKRARSAYCIIPAKKGYRWANFAHQWNNEISTYCKATASIVQLEQASRNSTIHGTPIGAPSAVLTPLLTAGEMSLTFFFARGSIADIHSSAAFLGVILACSARSGSLKLKEEAVWVFSERTEAARSTCPNKCVAPALIAVSAAASHPSRFFSPHLRK